MMRQIFRIIPGGKTFALKIGGLGTCAVSYQGAVVMIGGCCPHGKVDRWEKTIISVSPFPSQIRLGLGRQLPTRLSTRPSGRKILSRLHYVHIFRRRRGQIPKFAFFSNSYSQGLLVTGGSNGREYLSSTELYLPSKKQWTRGKDLPRHLKSKS